MRRVVTPTFFWLDKPAAQVVRDLADQGVRLLELSADQPATHIDLRDHNAVKALASLLQELGTKVHSVHAAFANPDPEEWDFSNPNHSARWRAIGNHSAVIRGAALLGAKHITIHPGHTTRGHDRLHHVRDSFATLAETANREGIKIAVENLPPSFVACSVAELTEVLTGLPADLVGFCLDTGHAMLGPNAPVQYVRALGSRLIAIHWHDNAGLEDDHIFPGFGKSDWESELLPALRDIGYDRPITIEAIPPVDVPIAQAISEAEKALEDYHAPRFG